MMNMLGQKIKEDKTIPLVKKIKKSIKILYLNDSETKTKKLRSIASI